MRLSLALGSLLATSAFAESNSRFFRRQNATTAPYELKQPPLSTDWTEKVGTNPWPQYPRPQLARSNWKNLNGVWQWQNASGPSDVNNPPFNTDLAQSALVPFCLESALSGIQGKFLISSWYRTHFDVPSSWPSSERVLLNFGAVDYEATIFVNGQKVYKNTGGYWSFTVDVTDQLSQNGNNELIVFAFDPTDSGDWQIPIGKQTLNPSHIFYTPCSGIWQTVWIESAPANYVTDLQLSAEADGKVNVTVTTAGNSTADVEVTIHEQGSSDSKATVKGNSGTAFQFTVDSPHLWSPDSPTLYNITVKVGDDTVSSYTGFRTISRGEIDGVQRPLLNGEFIFQFGTLDQGFWPDGLYTPPTQEAMVYDLKTLKDIGYNMLRKHIKVENALFYRAADELGLLLFQDMPSLRTSVLNPNATAEEKRCPADNQVPVGNYNATVEFGVQLERLVKQHRNYPSVVTWIIYNEGWGQPRYPQPYAEVTFVETIRNLDPTRLIDAVTGWHDNVGVGDYHDNHKYSSPQCGVPWYSTDSTPYDPSRIAIQGEFGGLGNNVTIDHLWNVAKSIQQINQTYEIDATVDDWNFRAHQVLSELLVQVEKYSCSGAIWTQTTDVEGEVNGMLTYDRRVLRPDLKQWNADIQALYAAAASRGGRNYTVSSVQSRSLGLEMELHAGLVL